GMLIIIGRFNDLAVRAVKARTHVIGTTVRASLPMIGRLADLLHQLENLLLWPYQRVRDGRARVRPTSRVVAHRCGTIEGDDLSSASDSRPMNQSANSFAVELSSFTPWTRPSRAGHYSRLALPGTNGFMPSTGRWCTWRMEGEMAPTPSRYAMIRWLRTESGRPAASIRFRTATPMAASVCWAAKPRARSRGPISALYRPIVVSTSERWP